MVEDGSVTKTQTPVCKQRQQPTRLVAAIVFGALFGLAGCRHFASGALDCDVPNDSEIVVLTEPPIPEETEECIPPAPIPASLEIERPEERRWHLPIGEAITLALQQNRDLLVSHEIPDNVRLGITAADAEFDPLFQAGGEWRKNEFQVTNVIEGPGGAATAAITDFFSPPRGLADQLRLSKKTRTGGEVAANFGSTYQFTEPGGNLLLFNPIIRSALSFRAEQPLFRGSGREVNTINIRVARQMHHAAIRSLEVQIHTTVSKVASAYWSLYGAVAELVSLDISVYQARETWEKELEKLDLGESARPQVAEAREQLERFRSKQVVARKAVADAERRLRDLLGLPHEDGSRIIPITLPHRTEPHLDWESGVMQAMNVRPELAVRKSMLRAARLEVDRTKDRQRTDVRAYAGYSINGAGDKFDDSVNTILGNYYTAWWMGFLYEEKFGRRRECAERLQAEMAVSRSIRELEVVRQQIFSELHESYQAVTSSWEVIQRLKDRRTAAAEVLEARKAMYDVGEISLDLYLRATAAWSISLSEERSAIARYNGALARWEFARGAILDAFGVQLEQFNPENPDGAPEGKFLNDYLNPPQNRQDAEIESPEIPIPDLETLSADWLRDVPASQDSSGPIRLLTGWSKAAIEGEAYSAEPETNSEP